MRQLPNKFRKALLLSMYKPQLVRCPLFAGMPDAVITTVAMLMKPYLAVKDDDIFNEDEVGDEMFMIIHGEVKLISETHERFNGRIWVDGAFLGELPMLGMVPAVAFHASSTCVADILLIYCGRITCRVVELCGTGTFTRQEQSSKPT